MSAYISYNWTGMFHCVYHSAHLCLPHKTFHILSYLILILKYLWLHKYLVIRLLILGSRPISYHEPARQPQQLKWIVPEIQILLKSKQYWYLILSVPDITSFPLEACVDTDCSWWNANAIEGREEMNADFIVHHQPADRNHCWHLYGPEKWRRKKMTKEWRSQWRVNSLVICQNLKPFGRLEIRLV